MKCPNCENETFIDHVTDGKYAYVCMNPKCTIYRKAQYLTGEETETQIQAPQ